MISFRGLAIVGSWVATVFLSGMLLGGKVEVVSEVKARCLTLLDEKGRERAKLLGSPGTGNAALMFLDKSGVPRCLFGLREDGDPLLRFLGKDGKSTRLAAYTDKSGQVCLQFFDKKGLAPSLTCGVTRRGSGYVSLSEEVGKGGAVELVTLSLPKEGSPHLILSGRHSANVLHFKFDSGDRPMLQIRCDGEARDLHCKDLMGK